MNQPDRIDEGTQVLDFEERTWLPNHCRGDQQAFAKLMHTYAAPVYRFLRRQGITTTHCDDVFQEVFLKVHQAAHQYQPNRPLRPWLFTIALNTARNFFRAHAKEIARASEIEPDTLTSQYSDGEQLNEQQSQLTWLLQQISKLPQRQREVIVMSTIDGLKQREIANILQLPLNTVKTHLSRARKALIAGLAKQDPFAANTFGENHDTL